MTRCLLIFLSALGAWACEAPPVPSPQSAYPVASAAEIVSVRVFESEMREGMRRVRVQVRIPETPPREVTITEWVPVVLLGRLQPGASVQLVPDPVEDRLTLSL